MRRMLFIIHQKFEIFIRHRTQTKTENRISVPTPSANLFQGFDLTTKHSRLSSVNLPFTASHNRNIPIIITWRRYTFCLKNEVRVKNHSSVNSSRIKVILMAHLTNFCWWFELDFWDPQKHKSLNSTGRKYRKRKGKQ